MRVLAVLALLLGASQEKPRVVAIRGGKVYPAAAAPIENGTILIEGGKFAAVGKDLPLPANAIVVDASGKVVIPGLVDPASRLFLEAGERAAGSAEQDVLDALDRYPLGAREAVENGVTTVYVGPPSHGAVNGLGAVLRLDRDRTVLAGRAALKLTLGSSAGDISSAAQRYEGFVALRQVFEGARQYVEAKEKYRKDLAEFEQKKKAEPEKKPPAPEGAKPAEGGAAKPPAPPQKPKIDPRQEVLARALERKQPLTVRVEVHTADAIVLALRLADEFKLKLVLEGVTEGHMAMAEIRKAGCAVVAGPVFRYGAPHVDHLNHSVGSAAAMVRWGIPVAIGSFGEESGGGTRFLLEAAGWAASRGMTREQALGAVTLEPARALGIDKSVGSIEKGKLADLAILSGEPFEAGTLVERTIAGGETVYSRTRE
jgi:imidazolonepropionase-like amidohydrolase